MRSMTLGSVLKSRKEDSFWSKDLITRKPKEEEVLWFIRQLHSLYKAGIPLTNAISMIESQASSPGLRKSVHQLRTQVESGKMLSEALDEQSDIYSPLLRGAVVGGERGGVLQSALEKALEWMTHEYETRREIRKALTYPIMVCVAFVIAVIVILAVVVPAFEPLFAQFGDDLPLPTRVLLGVRDLFVYRGLDLLVFLGATAVASMLVFDKPTRARLRSRFAWKFQPFRTIVQMKGTVRLGAAIGLLLGSGLPLPRAIRVGGRLVGVGKMQDELEHVYHLVVSGTQFSDSLQDHRSFPDAFKEIAAVGEASGQLDHLMLEISRHYDEELRQKIHKWLRFIEPLLSAGLAIFVLGLALAIFAPYWRLLEVMQ